MLLLINVIDFIGGVGLIAFGAYVYDKKYAPDYVYITITAMGMFVLITTFYSTCGACCWNSCWACCLYPVSAMMGILLCLGEITCGSLLIAYHKKYTKWLNENHQKYNISESEVEQLKHGLLTVAIGLFALAFMEILRFCVSKRYKKGKRYDEAQQRMLDEHEDMEQRALHNERSRERAEKHAKLRAHYAEKYNL